MIMKGHTGTPEQLSRLKCPALDFSSGHDLTVCGMEPHIGLCADSVEPSWESLSAPPLLVLCLSLSNKHEKIFKKRGHQSGP